jgi:dihydrodipicolinate synthase/N-acetylneuraminate lyase
LHAVVIAGTNGEAVTLSRDEKSKLVQLTRQVATELGKPELPICVGTSGQCTRDVISETTLAAKAGGDFALVLTPSYFHFAMNTEAIASFFEEVANSSPLPLVIYNFPGVAAGIDLDSDLLIRLGKNPNIAGVKLTCGGIAKVARISATYSPEQFLALAGQSDWLVPALSVGGTGSITGVANLYPKVSLSTRQVGP